MHRHAVTLLHARTIAAARVSGFPTTRRGIFGSATANSFAQPLKIDTPSKLSSRRLEEPPEEPLSAKLDDNTPWPALGDVESPANKPTTTNTLIMTPTDLYQHISHLLHLSPPTPLPILLQTHTSNLEFSSAQSFNLLLYLSIRLSSFSTFRTLLAQMRRHSVPFDDESWRMAVRGSVRQGLMGEATSTAIRAYKLGQPTQNHTHRGANPNCLPLKVWLELLTWPGHVRPPPPWLPEWQKHSRPIGRAPSSPAIPLGQVSLSPSEISRLPAHALKSFVRFLLQPPDPKPDMALSLTREYLRSLPPVLAPRFLKTVMSIIHLHLRTSNPPSPASERTSPMLALPSSLIHSSHKRLLFSLISLHPRLKPNGDTVLLLLASLRRSKGRGGRAYKLMEGMTEEYGIEQTPRMWRLIASYSIDENRKELAGEMFSRYKAWMEELNTSPPSVRSFPPDPERGRRLLEGDVWKGEGRERVRWGKLRRKFLRRGLDVVREEQKEELEG